MSIKIELPAQAANWTPQVAAQVQSAVAKILPAISEFQNLTGMSDADFISGWTSGDPAILAVVRPFVDSDAVWNELRETPSHLNLVSA
jgi:hypothetical protein